MANLALNVMADPNSPFFSHLSESPSVKLVSSPLTETNYHVWCRAMTMALVLKNKLGFINGSMEKPDPEDLLRIPWERNNSMVLSWISHSLSPKIYQSIFYMDQASAVWNDLKQHFSQSDIYRIADLQEQLYPMRQVDLTITSYFTQLKSVWDELEMFKLVRRCQCLI